MKEYVRQLPPLRKRKLHTLAFGSATFGNSRMGSSLNNHSLTSFLRLRIFDIGYVNDPRTQACLPILNLVARGVSDDAHGYSKHLDIFDFYWLDALHRVKP